MECRPVNKLRPDNFWKWCSQMYCTEVESSGFKHIGIPQHIKDEYTYQHGGSEVKFIKELSDKNVDLHQSLLVSVLHFTDDVGKPLILLLSTSHPDKVYLQPMKKMT